jgi:tripartite ATP-independent transporter DctM subunit
LSAFAIGIWSFPVVLALIFLRVPIGLSMLLVGICGNLLLTGSTQMMMSQFKHVGYGTFSSYSLSIVPLFLLMGQFAGIGGMSASLFKAAEAWLGHRKGGLAMAAIGACAGFGSICGSSLATAATMGQVSLPELRRYGYSGTLATGALAAGGTLGILIPPSVVLVIYAILAEQNIAKLFVAAMLPGILAAVGYMVVIALYVRLYPESAGTLRERLPWTKRFSAMAETWPVLIVFLVVVGGIYMGVFTPTEAAAIGAAGTGLIAWLNGGLNRKTFMESILATANSTAMIFFIVLGASVYNTFLALAQVPQTTAAAVGDYGLSPMLVMTVILVLYLIFGCIMDSLSMILLTVPIFYPIVVGLDFGMSQEDTAIWFGILALISVEVGLITPPVGLNLFVINSMAKDIPLTDTMRGVVPFILSDLLRVVILAAFPIISLIGVRLLY